MTTAPLKMAVIGSGIWGNQHANVFSTLAETELAAVCDLDETRARTMAGKWNVATVETDFRKLLERDDIDGVSIATPDFTHTPLLIEALKAGKHILCEKPLSTDLAEAEEIAALAAGTDATVMLDFHNRLNPAVAAAQSDIAAGTIGRVIHADGRLSNTQFVPLDMLSWASKSSALWFLGSHLIDAFRFALGAEVVRVFSMKREGFLKSKGVDTQDVHLSMLEFDNGTIVNIENSWVMSRDNPQVFHMQMNFVGEDGQLQADPSHSGAYRRMAGQGLRFQDLLGETPTGIGRIGGYTLESIARFVDSVRHGAPLLAGVKDGLEVTRILDAIERSAATRQPVDVQR